MKHLDFEGASKVTLSNVFFGAFLSGWLERNGIRTLQVFLPFELLCWIREMVLSLDVFDWWEVIQSKLRNF